METIGYLVEQVVLLIINVVVGVLSFRGYYDSNVRERPLFYLGVSSILGALASIASLVLWLSQVSDRAYEDGWLTIRFVSLFDACIWAWAVCALIERFKRLQRHDSSSRTSDA